MSVAVFIFGESGRMGQEVKSIVNDTKGLEFVGGYSAQNPDLNPQKKPDVVIDFSLPETRTQLVDFVKAQGCSLVSGTTGFKEDDFMALKELGQQTSVFWAANMSFGVYLMSQLTEILAKYQAFYEFHVEETHHVHKKDKPSGTAIIIENSAKKSTDQLKPTISHREGEVFGIHRFIASSKNENLEIKHEAHNRSLFAQGAVDVAQWVVNQSPGFYGMDDFFKKFQGKS